MTTPTRAFCQRHGLSYDADQHATCPECKGAAAITASAPPRMSLLGRTTAQGARTTAQGARTTAQGARTTAHAGHRPSQLETQRPRSLRLDRPAPSPPSTRLHGWAVVGLLSLLAVVGYRQWARVPRSGAASPGAGAGTAVADAGAPPSSPTAAPNGRKAANLREESRSAAPARAWPVVRYRARAGELPDICRVTWLEMYDRQRPAPEGVGGASHERTPLMVAAESGSLEELQRLLGSTVDVDARDELNHTALTYAARRGRDAHVQALMRAGADGRTRGLWDVGGGSMTALDAALLEGGTHTARLIQREVLQSFFALAPPDLAVIDEAGDTPLHWVARYADPTAAKWLVERGADLELRNCPARPGDERGLHQDDLRSATPLLVAVWAGNPDVARQLLESQADARAVDERGRGVFHVMRHLESLSLTPDLLRAGADPALPDRDGKTPAELLSRNGLRPELARALAAAGRPIPSAPLSIDDLIGVITRLGSARGATARADDPAPVLALLGGNTMLVNETDAQGRTPLFEAALQGLPRVAEALVARGAGVDARDHGGATPLHLAADGETVALLVRLGASVDARDHGGATPLHLRAAAPRSLDAVTALVKAGAGTRLVDRGRRTPLDLARQSGSPDVVEYLETQR